MKPTDSDATIFRLPYAYYNLLMPGSVGAFCVLLFLLLGIGQRMSLLNLSIIGGVMIVVWLGVVRYSWWLFSSRFLAISSGGVEYRVPGVHIYAPWHNLDSIGLYHLKTPHPRYNRTLTVIYLKQPVLAKTTTNKRAFLIKDNTFAN